MEKEFILFWEEADDDDARGAVVREMFKAFLPRDDHDLCSFPMVVLAHSSSKAALEGIAEKLNNIEGLEDCASAVAAYKQLTGGE